MTGKKLRRPFVYVTEGEKKEAIRRNLSKSMKNPWHCHLCNRIYTLGGKHTHLKTKKHINNYYKDKPLIEL